MLKRRKGWSENLEHSHGRVPRVDWDPTVHINNLVTYDEEK